VSNSPKILESAQTGPKVAQTAAAADIQLSEETLEEIEQIMQAAVPAYRRKARRQFQIERRDLASLCEMVLVSVTDDTAQQNVMFGQDGALAGVHDGSVIIDLSTVSPGASRRLNQAVWTGSEAGG